MSYSGAARGDFFSRTSNLIHLYNGQDYVYEQDRYASFQTEEIARLIEEQVQLGAKVFLWIVCGTLTLPTDETALVEGEYRDEDGNYVSLFSTTITGGGHFVERNLTASGLVPLSHWRLEREPIDNRSTFLSLIHISEPTRPY